MKNFYYIRNRPTAILLQQRVYLLRAIERSTDDDPLKYLMQVRVKAIEDFMEKRHPDKDQDWLLNEYPNV